MASPTGPWGSLSTCLRESQVTLVGNRVPVMSVQLRAWIVLGASWGTSPSSPGGIHSDIGGGGTWHVALGSGLDLFCLGPGVLASPVHSRGRCVLRLQGSGQGAPRGSSLGVHHPSTQPSSHPAIHPPTYPPTQPAIHPPTHHPPAGADRHTRSVCVRTRLPVGTCVTVLISCPFPCHRLGRASVDQTLPPSKQESLTEAG